MASASNGKALINRTDRGLTIVGTRITLYDVIDHLMAGWTPKLILNWLPLTEEQLNAALAYIEANRPAVEAEYRTVLQEAQEIREYWEEQNRERLAQIAQLPPEPGKEDVYAKLQSWKERLGLLT
ncbi:MAG: DUF433 domain-containing protein [Cyanothece sp. SIO2G6]|nr:DUF433 domain-containing protein [Cyanothece sp. SIO2G6]